MWELIIAVALASGISAVCSVAEAVIYSVSWTFIERLKGLGRKSGQVLHELRSNIEQPITAILTLNTIANTAGAAVAGAAAAEVFGQENLFYFSIFFTLFILIFSEIIPKTIGVVYNEKLAPVFAKPLLYLVLFLKPVINLCRFLVKFIEKKKVTPPVSEEDLLAVISLTRKSGAIKPYEEQSIQNILSLDKKTVKDIMTPRMVVFSLPAHLTVAEARKAKTIWPHSRIPVYADDDPEDIVGIVYRREVLEALANDQDELKLEDLMKPVHFVLESLTLDRLLIKFLESRMHLFVVLDEYGGVAGVVTLEDVLEEILGKEIVDETDQVVDMRQLAREQRKKLIGN
ncbi:HlyC/CorC family transporter [Desulfohalobiaceae bacterium Ax17]|uniref:hemolysin family protein n=1 Tax=Desulfovulcanus ferrireducens TaxID=2831190 RepID=UPI00207BC308|nr:hemolysin family protein [Desulfovulcanus ferrireducens]MBT8762392.1 HlyC/CorC family transporter [Desulfovulcanus ferrireducens]